MTNPGKQLLTNTFYSSDKIALYWESYHQNQNISQNCFHLVYNLISKNVLMASSGYVLPYLPTECLVDFPKYFFYTEYWSQMEYCQTQSLIIQIMFIFLFFFFLLESAYISMFYYNSECSNFSPSHSSNPKSTTLHYWHLYSKMDWFSLN